MGNVKSLADERIDNFADCVHYTMNYSHSGEALEVRGRQRSDKAFNNSYATIELVPNDCEPLVSQGTSLCRRQVVAQGSNAIDNFIRRPRLNRQGADKTS